MILSMRLLILLHFLTFVLQERSFAAPAQQPKPPKATPQIQNKDEKNHTTESVPESTQISYPSNYFPGQPPEPIEKPLIENVENLQAQKTKINTITLGLQDGYLIKKDAPATLTTLGYERAYSYDLDRKLDFGFAISAQEVSLMHVGLRWLLDPISENKIFLKVSFYNYINFSELFAALVNINNFKAVVQIGLSELELWRFKVRPELGFGYGLNGYVIFAQAGSSF